MGFKRIASARWEGDLVAGKGSMSTPQSGLFTDQNYSFKTRFGDEKGTNPEELLAAAHAGWPCRRCSAKPDSPRTGSKPGPKR
jgi:osmotically inducible protein OsmC